MRPLVVLAAPLALLAACSSDSVGAKPPADVTRADAGQGGSGGTEARDSGVPAGGSAATGLTMEAGTTGGSGATVDAAAGGSMNPGAKGAAGTAAADAGPGAAQGGGRADGGVSSDAGLEGGLDASAGNARDAGGAPVDSGSDEGCKPLAPRLLTADLDNPVYATAPEGDSRVFVLERRAGRIALLDASGRKLSTFLDISSEISNAGFEAGLLSLAFPPDFAKNGTFYVSYTTASTLRVSRFRVPQATPNVADPATESIVIEAPQASHHDTGGMLLFGPDGYLYVAIGDDDEPECGQDLTKLDAKMLRIAVDPASSGYSVPPDNPFVSKAGARPEIWASGLREPFRFWFDALAGNLYIADVGDSAREEIDVVKSSAGGLDFGWPTMEGTLCHTPATGCTKTGLTLPVYDYPHTGGETAVIGAIVYRGTALPACYRGKYFFGTYGPGTVQSLLLDDGAASVAPVPGLGDPDLISFGQDGHGELLLIDSQQAVYRVVPAP